MKRETRIEIAERLQTLAWVILGFVVVLVVLEIILRVIVAAIGYWSNQ